MALPEESRAHILLGIAKERQDAKHLWERRYPHVSLLSKAASALGRQNVRKIGMDFSNPLQIFKISLIACN